MAAICDICGKRPSFGNSVSRLGKNALKRSVKGRARRMFKPNVQRLRVVVDGTPQRITACTACIKAGKVERRT